MKYQSREQILSDVKSKLGNNSEIILPPNIPVQRIVVEFYQSVDFRRALLDIEPGRENESDRTIAIVDLPERRQVIVISGKILGDNPYALMVHGADLRPEITTAYTYDGNETIVGYQGEGIEGPFVGTYGHPEALIPSMRRSAGRLVDQQEL